MEGTNFKTREFFRSLQGKTVTFCGIARSHMPLIEMFGKEGIRVTARDSHGPIGEGRHERVIIQNEKFLQKALKKVSRED